MPASSLCDAHINSSDKYINQDDWVTSGKLGTREAVLVFRTNILNPKNRKTLLEKTDAQVDQKKGDGQPFSTPNKVVFKEDLSPTISKTAKNNLTQGKLYMSVNKLKKFNNVDNFATKSHDSFSSCEEVSSDGDETQYNESKSRTKHQKNKNLMMVENNDNLAKESGHDSITASQSNLEINTSEEDQEEASSEEDKECGINMPAHQLQITYKFIQTETKLLRKIFNVHGLTEVHGESNFNLLWTGVHMKLDTLRNLSLYQRVNHFPRSYELTRKDRLYKNIERMQHLRGMKHFDIVPQSFILPLESRDLIFAHNKHRGPWIVKPAASSRGRGIFIVNSPDQIPQDEQVLVSKYIVDPLCIDGHKCDLRVWYAKLRNSK